MAMLATLEGPETVESDDYILGRMFSPNDGLGVELLGVDGWNRAKNKVANAARKALRDKRLFVVPELIYFDPTPCKDNLADVLFGIDENYCNEMLGFSLTKAIKKAASSATKAVKSAAKTVTKKVKTATTNPIKSARDTAKAALKQVKKYSSPTKALQLSLSPTLQAKAIAETDPTGISTAVISKTYKAAPDVLPSIMAEKSTEKTVKYDPTGISQKLYKMGKKGLEVQETTSPTGAYDLYKRTQKMSKERAKEKAAAAETASTGDATTQEPQIIYKQVPGTTQYIPVQTESTAAAFDWSTVFNWKTFLMVGGVAYFIFGRRGRGGKRR